MLSPSAEQDAGATWLANRTSGLLADVPGLGKTGQALLAAQRAGAERVVVLCPAVARLNWEREVAKWGVELPVLRITDRGDHHKPSPSAPQLVIASYDGLATSRQLRARLNAGTWDALVLDEAHRLKTPTSRRTKAVYGMSTDGRNCLAGKALRTWLLSGSPMPNHAGELWTHFSALWPDLIRERYSGRVLDQEGFIRRYCQVRVNEYGGYKVLGYHDREGLIALLNRVMLRRTRIEGLPELVIRDDPTLVEVEDAELAALEQHEEFEELQSVLNSAAAREQDLEGIEDEFIHLATLRRLTGVLKARGAAELIGGEVGQGDKVVVFAIHREVIERLESYLKEHHPAVIHGGTPDGRRNEEIDRFQEDPSCQVFIGQVEACKEAITLTAGNRIWVVEAPWSPETLGQVLARCHRRGQTKTVFARFVAIAGSIDETVAAVLSLKARNIQAIMSEKYGEADQ